MQYSQLTKQYLLSNFIKMDLRVLIHASGCILLLFSLINNTEPNLTENQMLNICNNYGWQKKINIINNYLTMLYL